MKYLLTFLFFFCALFTSVADNYLVATVDGVETTYLIDSPKDFESTNHATSTSGAGDYSFTSNSETVTVTRSAVKSVKIEIPLTRAIKENETYFCAYLFYGCTNLTEANITFGNSDECTSVGDYFCYYMFYCCSGLVSLPDSFNLPQGITSVGNYFCYAMFYNCSDLVSLPDSFNLPQGITSVGNYFCCYMFSGCRSLVSLPDFNLPQGITTVGDYFCYYMFQNCTKLISLPDEFNLPQGITSVEDYFCNCMFYGCSGLVSLPDTFNIPQGIKTVKNNFCDSMFYGCSGLVSLPDSFNIPQEITKVGTYFCDSMFSGCSGLVSLPDAFNIPLRITDVETYFCARMFYNCSDLVSLPDSFNLPQGITSVGNYFCYHMFYNCSGLVSLPDTFNLPQGITSEGGYFCSQMFRGCSSLVSLPDNFNLPQNIETTSASNFCNSMFYNCSKLAEGTTVELTFPFEATNAFYGTSFAETTKTTTASAGTTYKLKGNSDFYKIRYYDQDGNLIKTQHIEKPEEGSVTINEFAVDGTTLVEDPENYAFRGWCYESGEKATVKDKVTDNISLYALVTAIEKPDGNSIYEYDYTDKYFYAEDHECTSARSAGGDIIITVGKEAYIIIETDDTESLYLVLYILPDYVPLIQETDDAGNLVYHYEGEDQANIWVSDPTGDSVVKITIQNVADYYRHITYYDQYNEIIGTQKIEVDTQITDFAVTADDLELSELQVFGGWKYSDGTVATVEDIITEDVALYPIITTIVIEEPTSISSVTTSAELVGVEYYDLAGRKLAEPQHGVNIVVEYYSDGTQKSTKLLQK